MALDRLLSYELFGTESNLTLSSALLGNSGIHWLLRYPKFYATCVSWFSTTIMFTKVAKRVARRSMPVHAEEIPPSIELPQRQIVDCAPDLFRWCDLQTPFPAVSYGGYIKYYKTRSTNNHPDSPSYTPRLANLSQSSPASGYTPPVPTPLFQKLKPTLPKILCHETVEPIVTPRKARGFSLPFPGENSRPSSPFVLWKKAVHVLTPNTNSSVGSHSNEQIVSNLSLATTGHIRLPSLGIPRSPSEGSSDPPSSDSESTPSYQRSRRDSYSPTYPDTPATSYSECGVDHFSAVVVKAGGNAPIVRRRRQNSSSSYMTARSEFDQSS